MISGYNDNRLKLILSVIKLRNLSESVVCISCCANLWAVYTCYQEDEFEDDFSNNINAHGSESTNKVKGACLTNISASYYCELVTCYSKGFTMLT